MRENTYLSGEPICAIKRRVSAQLRNNIFEHVIEQDKSIMYHNQIESISQSINQSHMWGPHQNPFILHELIPITPLLGIMEMNSYLFFLKHFKRS